MVNWKGRVKNLSMDSDADYAGLYAILGEKRSRSGMKAAIGAFLYAWYSRYQQCRGTELAITEADQGDMEWDMAISSAESEIHGAADACKEALHYKHASEELGIDIGGEKMIIRIDASAAYGWIYSTATVSKLKHIDMRLTWVRMIQKLKEVEFRRVPGPDNGADPFTKILQGAAFTRWQEEFMTPLDEVD